ncbi:hypothetical protein, partial [Escherichia coli]
MAQAVINAAYLVACAVRVYVR